MRLHGNYRPRHGKRRCDHHLRIRYLCIHAAGRHTFSLRQRLPRDGPCESCDRGFSPRDAPYAPRGFMHLIPDIARGLVLVGQGYSYRKAGRMVRTKSGVVRYHPKRTGTEGGSDWGLVADWVELYSRVVTAGSLLTEWPAEGLLVDAVMFKVGGQPHPPALPGSTSMKPQWSVLCAMAPYGPGHRMRIVRMRAIPGAPDTAAYEALFRELPGTPAYLLSDQEKAIGAAVKRVWPGIPHRYAWDKLELRLKTHLLNNHLRQDALYDATGSWHSKDPAKLSIFRDQQLWNQYAATVRARAAAAPMGMILRLGAIAQWVNDNEPAILAQFGAMPYWPDEAAVQEQAQVMLKAAFEFRATFTCNQLRTNLLLDLMTCAHAETAGLRDYIRRLQAFDQGSLGTVKRHGIYHGPLLH